MRRVPPSPASAAFAFFVLLAEAPLVGAEHARAGALGEREQPRPQRVAIERLDGVEQRQQEHRRQVREADDQQREDVTPAVSHQRSGDRRMHQ